MTGWDGWAGRRTDGWMTGEEGRAPGARFQRAERGDGRGEKLLSRVVGPAGPSPDLSALRRRCSDLQNAWHFHKTRCERAAKIKSALFAIVPTPQHHSACRSSSSSYDFNNVRGDEGDKTEPKLKTLKKRKKEKKSIHAGERGDVAATERPKELQLCCDTAASESLGGGK